MARLLFLHEIPYEFIGVMSLASYVKEAGHDVELLIKSEEGKKFWPKVEEYKPDVVAFSTMIFVHFRTIPFARLVKERLGVPVIMGGPYPTYEPEKAIEKPYIDAIVRGEGEVTLLDMLNAFETIDLNVRAKVKLPWTRPLLRKAVYWPLTPIYEVLFLFSFFLRYMRETDLSLLQVMNTAFRQIREYWNKPFERGVAKREADQELAMK